jgi:hypothetical protein
MVSDESSDTRPMARGRMKTGEIGDLHEIVTTLLVGARRLTEYKTFQFYITQQQNHPPAFSQHSTFDNLPHPSRSGLNRWEALNTDFTRPSGSFR